jgi:transcriptional regulator with XRE-family HTH domain
MERAWLKELRKRSGMQLKQIASAAGISEVYYYYIESGERGSGDKLNVAVAKQIAEVLGFDWTRFYEEEDA